MFQSAKDWATKKIIERQLKDVPEEKRDMILEMIEKNPGFMQKLQANQELLTKMNKEIEAEIARGTGKVKASIEIGKKYQKQLAEIFADVDPKLLQALMGK